MDTDHNMPPEQEHFFSVRRLNADDIKMVSNLHIVSFPGFFLSILGKRFLEEFYNGFLSDETGLGFVAEDMSGKILGAIVGPMLPNGFFSRLLKRRWWAFCVASTGAVVKHPTCIPRLFRALFYRGETPEGTPRALISSIAVSPEAQGRGIGKALVENWVAAIREKGISGCYLTTDARHNTKTNAFYTQLGWQLESCYITPEGREMHIYVYDFAKSTDLHYD